MKTSILVVGLACLSAVAVAQSDGSQQKSSAPSSNSPQVTSPRDQATGQASGKRMHKPMPVTTQDETALRESPSKASLGKTNVRVAGGDVNGDGKADVAATAPNSNTKSPREAATGQASGKVNVQDLTVMKRTDSPAPAQPKK